MRSLLAGLRNLQRLLRRRGATREQAEDLVQEAVLRLHAFTQRGGSISNRTAFLRRTVLNLAVDEHRQLRGDRYESAPVEELELLDLGPSPDELYAAEQRLERMCRVLECASARTRQVFFMHRLHGYSHAEIAHQLGISISAVEKHVASAITALALERQQR